MFREPGKTHRIQAGAIDEDGVECGAAGRAGDQPEAVRHPVERHRKRVNVRFSRSVDASVLNLYESALDPQGGTDLVLVGPDGKPVRGNLILDADRQGFSFVATGGGLVAGRYELTLSARTNAFVDSDGIGLDGNRC